MIIAPLLEKIKEEYHPMTEIEKMKKYIERTKLNISSASPYQMSARELFAASTLTVFDAVNLAFKYGQAKGYRAAKAERRATV